MLACPCCTHARTPHRHHDDDDRHHHTHTHTRTDVVLSAHVAVGWLGIMVGSRLYFRVVREVLSDDARYEAVMDDIVQEVRRRAPSSSAGAVHSITGVEAPESELRPAHHSATAAPAEREVETTAGAMGHSAGGAGVVLSVHNNSNVNNSTNNCGNSSTTTMILL